MPACSFLESSTYFCTWQNPVDWRGWLRVDSPFPLGCLEKQKEFSGFYSVVLCAVLVPPPSSEDITIPEQRAFIHCIALCLEHYLAYSAQQMFMEHRTTVASVSALSW